MKAMIVFPFFLPSLPSSSVSGPPPTLLDIFVIALITVSLVVIGYWIFDCILQWTDSDCKETLAQIVWEKMKWTVSLLRRII